MREPKYTDRHRYPHGYKPANQTNVKETFDRVENERKAAAKERLEKCIDLRRKAK